MREETPGTGEAVEHAVRTEHRRLEELFAEVQQALQEPGDVEDTLDTFAALREEIEVHFDQEDHLYYASIGALRPDLKPELEAFAEGHRGFRLELESIAGQLERRDLEAVRRAFATLRSYFEQHEHAEERVIARAQQVG